MSLPADAAPPAEVSALPLILLSTLLTHYNVGYFSVDAAAPALDRWPLLLCKAVMFPAHAVVGELARGAENRAARRALLAALFVAAAALLYALLTRALLPARAADSAELVRDLVGWVGAVGAAAVALA